MSWSLGLLLLVVVLSAAAIWFILQHDEIESDLSVAQRYYWHVYADLQKTAPVDDLNDAGYVMRFDGGEFVPAADNVGDLRARVLGSTATFSTDAGEEVRCRGRFADAGTIVWTRRGSNATFQVWSRGAQA